VAHFLKNVAPCKETADKLLGELHQHGLLGMSMNWKGEKENATYDDVKTRVPSLGPEHLARLVSSAIASKESSGLDGDAIAPTSVCNVPKSLLYQRSHFMPKRPAPSLSKDLNKSYSSLKASARSVAKDLDALKLRKEADEKGAGGDGVSALEVPEGAHGLLSAGVERRLREKQAQLESVKSELVLTEKRAQAAGVSLSSGARRGRPWANEVPSGTQGAAPTISSHKGINMCMHIANGLRLGGGRLSYHFGFGRKRNSAAGNALVASGRGGKQGFGSCGNYALKKFRTLKSVSGHFEVPVFCVVFDHSGEIIVTGSDCVETVGGEGSTNVIGLVKVWNIRTGLLVASLRGHRGNITDIAISPNNQILATAADDLLIRLWNLSTCHPTVVLKGHESMINLIRFDPLLGSLVSCSDDGTCRVWHLYVDHDEGQKTEMVDMCTGKTVDNAKQNTSPCSKTCSLRSAAQKSEFISSFEDIQPSQRHSRWVEDNDVDGMKLKVSQQILPHTPDTGASQQKAQVNCLAYCPFGIFFATGDQNGGGRVWRNSFGDKPAESPSGCGAEVEHPSLKSESVSIGAPASQHSAPQAPPQISHTTGNLTAGFTQTQQAMPTFGMLPQPSAAATFMPMPINVPLPTGVPSSMMPANVSISMPMNVSMPTPANVSPVLSSTGTSAALGIPSTTNGSATARAADTAAHGHSSISTPICFLMGHLKSITTIAFNHVGDSLATASMEDGSARIWNWMEHVVENGNTRLTDSIVLHCGSHTASEGTGRGGRGKKKKAFVSVDTVVWGAHDKLVVTAQSTTPMPSLAPLDDDYDFQQFFKVWNPRNGALLQNIKGHRKPVHVLEQHPSDWRIFFSGGWDGRVCLWNMFSGELLKEFQASRPIPASMSVDPASIILGSIHSTVNDDVIHFEAVQVLDGHFSPDGTQVIVSDQGGRWTLYGVENALSCLKAPPTQYTAFDYFDLQWDEHGNPLDATYQIPPHMMQPGSIVDNLGKPYEPAMKVTQKHAARPLPLQRALSVLAEKHSRGLQVLNNAALRARIKTRLGHSSALMQSRVSKPPAIIHTYKDVKAAKPFAGRIAAKPVNYQMYKEDDGDDFECDDNANDSDFDISGNSQGRKRKRKKESNADMPLDEMSDRTRRVDQRRATKQSYLSDDDDSSGEESFGCYDSDDLADFKGNSARDKRTKRRQMRASPSKKKTDEQPKNLIKPDERNHSIVASNWKDISELSELNLQGVTFVDVGTLKCAFCNKGHSPDAPLPGKGMGPHPLVHPKGSLWCHDYCAMYSPEVYFQEEEETGGYVNVLKEIKRGRQLSCTGCGERGATIGCMVTSCRENYHFECAGQTGWDYEAYYCRKHRKKKSKKSEKSTVKGAGKICNRDWLRQCGDVDLNAADCVEKYVYVPQINDEVICCCCTELSICHVHIVVLCVCAFRCSVGVLLPRRA
jgi:WD40 repeat protein